MLDFVLKVSDILIENLTHMLSLKLMKHTLWSITAKVDKYKSL